MNDIKEKKREELLRRYGNKAMNTAGGPGGPGGRRPGGFGGPGPRGGMGGKPKNMRAAIGWLLADMGRDKV